MPVFRWASSYASSNKPSFATLTTHLPHTHFFFSTFLANCLCIPQRVRTFASQSGTTIEHRGVEQLVARQAHNLEVARSSRTSATKIKINRYILAVYLFFRGYPLRQFTDKFNRILSPKECKKNVYLQKARRVNI